MSILFQSSSVPGASAAFRPDLSTGTLASLAGSGVATLVFDLGNGEPTRGQGWRQVCTALVSFANVVTSAGGNVKAFFSDDGSATDQVPAASAYNNAGGQLTYSADLAIFVAQYMVTKRFLRLVITNGSTGQGATAKAFVVGVDQ